MLSKLHCHQNLFILIWPLNCKRKYTIIPRLF